MHKKLQLLAMGLLIFAGTTMAVGYWASISGAPDKGTSSSSSETYKVGKTYCINFTLRKLVLLKIPNSGYHRQLIDLYDEFGKAKIC